MTKRFTNKIVAKKILQLICNENDLLPNLGYDAR